MVLIEAQLALVEFTDPALYDLELGLGHLGSGSGLFDGRRQSGYAFVDGLHPGTAGLHLTGQPGQAFPAIRFGPHRGEVHSLGFGCRSFFFGELSTGQLRPRPGGFQLGKQGPFPLGHLLGLGLQFVGIGAGVGGGFGVEVLGALAGDADRSADPLG